MTSWPYPTWLKASLLGLLLLLGVALANGRKYFHAGREMYIGERLVEEKKYEAALPHLLESLRIAPNSDKAALLAAKAALSIGNVGVAYKALEGHSGGKFENGDDDDVQEVTRLWDRARSAMEKASKASELAKQGGHDEEAARLMREAYASYPEAKDLGIAADVYDEGPAFDRRDYDTFLALAQKVWKEEPNSEFAAMLASALACKYAMTGVVAYRNQSEEMLSRAEQMAHGNPDAMKAFQEYEERVRYRLESRQIIDTAEYNRKFRGEINKHQ